MSSRLDDVASSSSISSPPSAPLSPQNDHSTLSDTIHVAAHRELPNHLHVAGGVTNSSYHAFGSTDNVTNPTTTASDVKPKKPRKPREPKTATISKSDDKPKERKPRKTRESAGKKEAKDPVNGAAPRKRQKLDEKVAPAHDASVASSSSGQRQPTITEMVSQLPASRVAAATAPPPPPSMLSAPATSQQQHHYPPPPSATHTQQMHQHQYQQQTPVPQSQYLQYPVRPQQSSADASSRILLPPASTAASARPHSSGQIYDPIRGDNPRPAPSPLPSAQVSPRLNRASASPSINNVIDPPVRSQATAPVVPFTAPNTIASSTTAQSQPQSSSPRPGFPQLSARSSPAPSKPAPFALPVAPAFVLPTASLPPKPTAPQTNGAMDVDIDDNKRITAPEVKAPKSSSSAAPTPKAAKPTPPPSAPKGTGSGLLSNSDFLGGGSSGENSGSRKGIDIELTITLNRDGGNTINIAQEIFKKYGRDAINPRAALHRERLLQVAAAAHKLENSASAGDDMSVDLMSEPDIDSNVEMGGMDDSDIGAGAKKPTQRRRKKAEEYDKEDDFIDDTELAWQEQAAVAKDGFFVYSGPLVAPGQTAQVESANGAPTKSARGGGRGRGRGSRTAATANGTSHTSTADKAKSASTSATVTTTAAAAAASRGRGRGRGGTSAPRKPRTTKADREAEKLEKERTAAASTSVGPGSALTASHPTQQTVAPPATFAI